MSVPGEVSHHIMTPGLKKQYEKRLKVKNSDPRHAAILMLCYPKGGETHIALIVRPVYEGVHSGQVALPGGKVEEEDLTYEDTALRETEEEIGVFRSDVTIVQALTKTYIPPSNFWVHPFMGFSDHRPHFVKQEEEVAKILEVRIEDLLDENYVVTNKLSTSYATDIEVPSFELNGYIVWGATAMMLNELKVYLKSLRAL